MLSARYLFYFIYSSISYITFIKNIPLSFSVNFTLTTRPRKLIVQTKLACPYDEQRVFTETNNRRSGSALHVNEEATVIEFHFEYSIFIYYFWNSNRTFKMYDVLQVILQFHVKRLCPHRRIWSLNDVSLSTSVAPSPSSLISSQQ